MKKNIIKGITLAAFLLSMLILYSCNKQESSITSASSEPQTSVTSVTNSEYLEMREQAQKLAKLLAYDLNENDNHRREVFGRIANRFDGDYDMLVSHLSEQSTGEIQKIASSKGFQKISASINITENFIQNMASKYPKLQLMMPFAKEWTDEKIQQSGGLIVAYYPFGIDDKKVKEITGYDKAGNKITITRETAPNIPYLIINLNERTDDNGYLKYGRQIVTKEGISIEKKKSIYGLDPKNLSFSNKSSWRGEEINSLNTKNPVRVLKAMSEDGGDPPPVQTEPGFRLTMFMGFNLAQFEGWLESDAEIEITIKQMDVTVAGYSVSAATFMTIGAFDYDVDGGYIHYINAYARWDSRAHITPYPGITLWNDEFNAYVIEDDGSSYYDDPIGNRTFYKDTHAWGTWWPVVTNVAYLDLDSGNYPSTSY